MSKIDAIYTSQVADVSRPPQTARDTQQQADQARLQQAVPQDQAAVDSTSTAAALKSVAAQLKQVAQSSPSEDSRQLNFGVDESTGQPVMTITDPSTGELIGQVPAASALKLQASLESPQGIIVNQQA